MRNKIKTLIPTTNVFNKLVDRGILDLNLIFPNKNLNCMLLHIMFAFLLNTQKCSIENAIYSLGKIGIVNVYNTFLSKLNYLDEINQINFFDFIKKLSLTLKTSIYVLEKTDAFTNTLEICFKQIYFEDNVNMQRPIYLLATHTPNFHIQYLFNIILEKGKKICYLCAKAYFGQHHICIRSLCFLCCRYIAKKHENKFIDQFGNKMCRKLQIEDINYFCDKCNNRFLNRDCLETHSKNKNKRKFCILRYKCIKCNIYAYNNSNHICFLHFCRKCLNNHDKDSFCSLSNENLVKSAKCEIIIFYIQVFFSIDNVPIYSSITNLNSNKDSILRNKCEDDKIAHIIFNYFKNNNENKNKIIILCEEKSFNYILEEIENDCTDLNRVKLKFDTNGTCSLFTFKNVQYKNINAYFNNTITELSFYTNKNTLLSSLPEMFTNLNINSEKTIILDKSHFNRTIDYSFGSDIEIYNKMTNDMNTIINYQNELTGTFRNIFYFLTQYIYKINLECIFNLNNLYNSILNDLKMPNINIYTQTSISSASNLLFRLNLKKRNLPVLCNMGPDILSGSSKYEMVLARTLYKLHSLTCNPNMIISYCSNAGKQFTKGHLSSDFTCLDCKEHIFVEGTFKLFDKCSNVKCKRTVKITQFHQQNNKFLEQRSKLLREEFSKKNPGDTLFVFNYCCLENKNITEFSNYIKLHLIKHKIPMIPNFKLIINNFKYNIQNYEKLHYNRLNAQDVILTPFTTAICPYIRITNQSPYLIFKVDLKNAYSNALSHIYLPYKCDFERFVFNAADNLFNEIKHKQSNVGYAKAIVIPPHVNSDNFMNILPFFGYRDQRNNISFTLCKLCSQSKSTNPCKHNSNQRQFVVNGVIDDFILAEKLGYTISFLEICYYKQSKLYTEFVDVSRVIQSHRVKSKFNKVYCKRMLTCGLGFFASKQINSNLQKNCNTYLKVIAHANKKTTKKSKYYFNIYGNKNKPFAMTGQFNNLKKINKFNRIINPLIFASISNYIRRKIYLTLNDIYDRFGTKVRVLRIDTDSISYICTSKDVEEECIKKIFSDHNGYKTELDNIEQLISFKTKSYSYVLKSGNAFLKSCGLSISYANRFKNIDIKRLIQNYITEDNIKNIHCARVVCNPNIIKNEFFEIIESRPFGYIN